MLLFAVVASVCLCVPVFGLAGTEQKSSEFLFLLDKIGQLERATNTELNQFREKMHSVENKLEKVSSKEKDLTATEESMIWVKHINVHLDLSESQTCQSGKVEFSRDFSTRTVRFSKPFSRIPAVTYGMTLLDSSHEVTTRARCDISNVSATKFDVKCRTWFSSIIYNIHISWMAC